VGGGQKMIKQTLNAFQFIKPNMEAEDLFSNIVILTIGVFMILYIIGFNVSNFIQVIANIIILALVLSIFVFVVKNIIE
jgi:hypothetical protein